MHKSNAVPVMRDTEQAKEIARMRRWVARQKKSEKKLASR
jgi:hypothetical protein